MASTFKNAILPNIDAALADVYTVPAATTATVIGLTVANISGAAVAVDVAVYDSSGTATAYVAKGFSLGVGETVDVLAGMKLVLETGDKIQVKGDATDCLDAIASVLEQS